MPKKGSRKHVEEDIEEEEDEEMMVPVLQGNVGEEDEEEELTSAELALKFVCDLPPDVRNRVFALQGIQKDFVEVHKKYLEEMCELERRYEELYKPLFGRRKEIVAGDSEPTEDEVSAGAKITEVTEEGDKAMAAEEGQEAKGIPNFWLGVLQNNEETQEMITERDEECLKFLKDISAKNFDNPNKGFSLTFHFAPNPYLTNETLTKTYLMDDEDEIMLEKAEGCKIDWKPEKNLTVVLTKKKQKQKGGKGLVRTVTKEEPCDSFFNFFNPPQFPDDDEEDKEEEEEDDIEEKLEHDYEIGRIIKDRIVPSAIDWYTGEAFKNMRLPFGLGDEGMGDEDEDEDAEEDPDHAKIKKIVPPKQPPECKQQ